MESKIPFILFLSGLIFIIASFLIGESKAGIFIIFPFIYGNGLLAFIGIILIFLSFLFPIFSFKIEGKEIKNIKTGGIIFIGPLPIIFSNDSRIIPILLILTAIILTIFIIFLII
ncbi:MAG: DUF131 domain-containing protein [Thermoplasmata archaeon]|nr:DUF131 domain-containing protein [Thermoplasmata archaeon]